MQLNIWFIPILLLPWAYASKNKQAEELEPSVNLANIFKLKCDGLPFRSKFIAESTTCYVSLSAKSDCNEVSMTYGKLKRGIPTSDRGKLKQIGITEGENSQICGFTIEGECDSGEKVEDWCFNVQKKKRPFYEAAQFCEKKLETLAVLHNDLDIQRILKATAELKPAFFWIGAGTDGKKWKFHDSTEVDFFRFRHRRTFRKGRMGMVIQTKPNGKNDTFVGYSGVVDVNKKFPFICAKRINDDYRKPIKINKFEKPVIKTTTTTTTTTTLEPTTTTKFPRIENPKQWIFSNGRMLYRSQNKQYSVHHYTLLAGNYPTGFQLEKSPGNVVSEERYPEIKGTCPELLKVGIWRRGSITYIGNNPPAQFTQSESFYCAPRQFYCGANFQLRRVDKNGGGDIYYPSDDDEANTYLSCTGPASTTYRIERGSYLETPCWVWQNYAETYTTIVKAGGGMLWGRGDNFRYLQWTYSLDIYEAALQVEGGTKAGPGYVILEEAYDAYFKEHCPELVRMTVWQGSNGGYEYNTWFGRDGQSPPAHINTYVKKEARKFYCAPTKNYCGADFMLRRRDRVWGISGYSPQSWYPHNDAAEWAQVNVWAWKEDFCYIWSRFKGDNIFQ